MKTRRILTAILAIVIVLSTLTFGGFTVNAAANEYYVDQANGDDGAAGTLEAPFKTINKAFESLSSDGTIYIIGSYNQATSDLPRSSYVVTIAGHGVGAEITNPASNAIRANCPLIFKNIKFRLGTNAHFNSCGHKIVFGEGFDSTSMIHIGQHDRTTNGEHIVFTDGAKFYGGKTIGAYLTNSNDGINGNLTIEVLNGADIKDTLNIAQDGWQASHQQITIKGDVRIKVGAGASLRNIKNEGSRYANVKGVLHLIYEDGAAELESIDIPHFSTQDKYIVKSTTENGVVNFSDKSGYVNIVCDENYLAEIRNSQGVTYTGSGDFQLVRNDVTYISFTSLYQLAPASVDVTINPPEPGTSTWPVSVNNNKFTVEVAAHSPEDAEADFAKEYTYDVVLKTIADHAFPSDFKMTINGLEAYDKATNPNGYRIKNYNKVNYDEINFTYTTAETAKDTTRAMVSYYGGIGSALDPTKTLPGNSFNNFGESITIADNFYVQGGYRFFGYKDSVNGEIYKPGETYVTNEDVVFTAQWELVDTYSVVYQGGNGSTGIAPDSALGLLPGETATVEQNTFAKTGHKFDSWSDAAGNTYMPGDIIVIGTESLTLTANWSQEENAGTFYYVSSTGDDTKDGLTEANAVATIAKAYELSENNDATIIILDKATISSELPAHTGYVTITGADENSVLVVKSDIVFNGKTTIENIKADVSVGRSIVTNGQESVIGPNITNVGNGFDVIDGGVGKTVDAINTVIKPGVKINYYYFAGASHATEDDGVTGSAHVTITGAEIDTFDFSPKGDVSASVGEEIVLTIDGAKIKNFTASKSLKDTNNTKKTFIFFNNSTIPTGFENNTSLKDKLTGRTSDVYVIDAGLGGYVRTNNIARAQCTGVPTIGDVYYWQAGATTGYRKSGSGNFAAKPIANGINKVRFGTAYEEAIKIAVANPTAGAEARSIVPVIESADTVPCKALLSGWSPELAGGRFDYDKEYSATVKLVPDAGSFFDDNKLPVITINGDAAELALNIDGTLSATIGFPATDYRRPNITVELFDGTTPENGEKVQELNVGHMDSLTLPSIDVTNLGFRFTGWKDLATDLIYRTGSKFVASATSDVQLVATWQRRASEPLPNVLILYDLTAYATDKNRNPEFDADADVINVNKAFATLENSINGTKNVKQGKFDYETVSIIQSDDVTEKPFMINNYSLDSSKISKEHKYATIVYYYQTTTGAAVGDHGSITYGNLKLKDGKTSNWFGKGVQSKETVVANKWAVVTFDFTAAIDSIDFPEGAVLRQCHILPIGYKTCVQLAGDTLYLKALYFSKTPAITE